MRNVINKNSNIFRFSKLILTIPFTVLLLNTCDILNPADEDDLTDGGDTTPIGAVTIGPDGGEIDLDSMIVKIPANAFNEDNEIIISVSDGSDHFGNNSLSSLYQIRGLPNTINKQIKFFIKYNGTLEGDTLVAVGELKHSTSLDSTLYSYHSDEAIDSSGHLLYNFPTTQNLGKVRQGLNDNQPSGINIMVLGNNLDIISHSGHFKITCPMEYISQGVAMGNHFETAYKTCKEDLNIEFSREWPVKVLIKPLVSDIGQYRARLAPGLNDEELIDWIDEGDFVMDVNSLSDENVIRTTCGHEFLHLVQNIYEFSAPDVEPEQDWLAEATSVWIEEKFSDIQNYVASTLSGRELFPFNGWQYSGNGYSSHGYGLSVIIKSIAELYGDIAIVNIFKEIQAGILPSNARDPVDAILSVVEHPVEIFWHNTLSWYTLGHAYASKINFKFLDQDASYKGGIVTIDTSFTSQKLDHDYHDLSGKLFKLIPEDLSSKGEFSLSFKIDDPDNCGILVTKYKTGTEITSIGEVFPGGNGEIVINDVKSVFDNGYEIVVLITNSSHDANSNYQGKNSVELTIESKDAGITAAQVEFYIENATWRINYLADGVPGVANNIIPFEYDINSTWGTSSTNNNIFNTIISDYAYVEQTTLTSNITINGTMDITFLENPKNVNVSIDQIDNIYITGGGLDPSAVTRNTNIDFEGISFSKSEDTGDGYIIDLYEEIGNSVSGINLNVYMVNDDGVPLPWELVSYTIGASDYFRVYVIYPSEE